MKTALDRVSNEKAFTEMKRFTIVGVVLSLISVFILWPLAIGGIAFSGRGLLLTWHKANKTHEKIMSFRVMAAVGLIIGIVTLGLYQATH